MPQLSQRRKELVASLTRDAIHEAAIELIEKNGIDGLTMDRVAQAVGIAKGSLYKYFSDKQDLIRSVHSKLIEPALKALKETRDGSDSAPEKLVTVFRTWTDHYAAHRAIFDFLFNDPRTHDVLDDSKRTRQADVIDDLAAIFRQGIAEGSFRAVEAHHAAEMFLGVMIFMLEQEMTLKRNRRIDEMINTLMDLFLKGLEPRE